MYKESVAAPVPYVRSIAGFGPDFMKILLRNCKNRTHKNTPHALLPVHGALKTRAVFDCGKIPAEQVLCSRRSKVSERDLMLLTHTKCAFKGPRGRFGISDSARRRRVRRQTEG